MSYRSRPNASAASAAVKPVALLTSAIAVPAAIRLALGVCSPYRLLNLRIASERPSRLLRHSAWMAGAINGTNEPMIQPHAAPITDQYRRSKSPMSSVYVVVQP